MKRHELLDRLCRDEPDSPYPIASLPELEGLKYVELIELHRAIERGEAPPPLTGRGAQRRNVVEALGADAATSGPLAASVADALDQVGVALRRAGVTPPNGARAEVLAVAAQLWPHLPLEGGQEYVPLDRTKRHVAARDARRATLKLAVDLALDLVAEVNGRFAPRAPAPPVATEFQPPPGEKWEGT